MYRPETFPIHRVPAAPTLHQPDTDEDNLPMLQHTQIHQQPDWPSLRWAPEIANILAAVRHRQGRVLGRMETLGFELQQEANINTLIHDVVGTSAIEGEILDAEQVRSSIARRLGIDTTGQPTPNVDGVVAVTSDATQNYVAPLTANRLFEWHNSLFPTGRSNLRQITAGTWRPPSSDPMQVVSGPIGRERVHFQAPDAHRIPAEMDGFLEWFNAPTDTDWVLRAGMAHLWFVTIHPFDDGNGRIARAITDMALARSERTQTRIYSMSDQIRQDRTDYYRILEQTQKGTTDITPWMTWFLQCLDRALTGAETTVQQAMEKAGFWQSIAHITLNERQRRVVNLLLDGMEGNLTASRWARIAHCSQNSALSDIHDLIEHGVLIINPSTARNPNYRLRDAGNK